MTVTSGFFNSVNHDRKYNAEEISSIFDGIILDGVYQGFGEAFKVEGTSTANQVKIGSGRAWFNHTWTLNDEALYLTLPNPNSTYPRIDAIVLEVNNSSSVRANTIKYISGTATSSPTKPILTNTTDVHQYPLAYITRPSGNSTISAGNIENLIGSASCPIVTGVLEVLSDDRFIAQTIANLTTDFNTWFDGVKDVLDENTAAKLLNKINENTEKIESNYNYIQSILNGINIIIPQNYLGELTKEKQDKISSGNFIAIPGDYFTLNGVYLIVIDSDTFYNKKNIFNTNYTSNDSHHLLVTPFKLYSANNNNSIEYYSSPLSDLKSTGIAYKTDRYKVSYVDSETKRTEKPYITVGYYSSSASKSSLIKYIYNDTIYNYVPYDTLYESIKKTIPTGVKLKTFPIPIMKNFGGKIEYAETDMSYIDEFMLADIDYSSSKTTLSPSSSDDLYILDEYNSGLDIKNGFNTSSSNSFSYTNSIYYYVSEINNKFKKIVTRFNSIYVYDSSYSGNSLSNFGNLVSETFGTNTITNKAIEYNGTITLGEGLSLYGLYSPTNILENKSLVYNPKYTNKVYCNYTSYSTGLLVKGLDTYITFIDNAGNVLNGAALNSSSGNPPSDISNRAPIKAYDNKLYIRSNALTEYGIVYYVI